ncbi:MAG TPA: L-serine ammonia-lyase, iron-sulfur-dependent subunit beta [Gemmatimonadota bacterium]|nr:L-serine ammonia-lyase, iron-sulfur-dependent subunit beta [Gemmatimonadota bacterium]
MTGLFDILGPTMVGPSSSHTAGASRLGYVTQAILGGAPERARIGLHGSFAMTGEGHGTKKAIIGGLLGYAPDDERIRTSVEDATAAGMDFEFYTADLGEDAHPNSAVFEVERGEEEATIRGASIGGGQIRIHEIDGFRVDLSGSLPTLVVQADDVPGTIATITRMLSERGVNLATMHVDRTGRGEQALMTIESDADIPEELIEAMRGQDWVHWIRYVRGLV